jgi:fluoride exporter
MARLLFIGFAGALGTMARHLVALWAGRVLGTGFPYGTLSVNVAGCFLIALIAQISITTTLISPTVRLTLSTGFMGGLTTYSSFNYETTRFLQDRAWSTGLTNFGVTVMTCFAAGLLGYAVGLRLALAATA